MESISKEHIISGVIGGIVTVALHAAVLKFAPGFFGLHHTSKLPPLA